MLPPNPFSSYCAATACPGQRSPSEGNKCIEVCIAASACREMIGLWFGSPPFGALLGHPVGWYATRRRLGGGTLGCVLIPIAQGHEITSPALDPAIRQPAPLFTRVRR